MPDSKNKEIIEARELAFTPNKQSSVSSEARSITKWLWIGFVFLLILAGYVILLLPSNSDKNKLGSSVAANDQSIIEIKQDQINESKLPVASTQLEELKSTEILDDLEIQQAKIRSEELLIKIIELEANLEMHAVKKWAAEKFSENLEQGRIGDEYFRRQQYMQATESFQIAVDNLENLQQLIQPKFERAIIRGEQALTQGDQSAALQQFELAKAIFPKDIRAINGFQRVATLKQLFALLQRGSSFEFHNQLLQAKSVYQEAIELDSLSTEAQAAFVRVDEKLKDEEFNRMIATGYQALQNRQYADARAAFNAAIKLQPSANEAIIGLKKVAASIREEKVNNLLFEAKHFVQLQQWSQAASSYEKVLKINKNHKSARQGFQDSDVKSKIVKNLKLALSSAHQLYKARVLNDAEKVLASVAKIEFPGSVIEQYDKELQQLVRVATTPILVELTSDNKTEVVVFKVKRLGKFYRYELQLRPGPYTVVGTRDGFRDVRKKIQIMHESKLTSLSVVCEESI
jgi:tetratricopeptide (TPR) repeat protein